jgi:pimeloyl-ACP methyl ester carboxylesterase
MIMTQRETVSRDRRSCRAAATAAVLAGALWSTSAAPAAGQEPPAQPPAGWGPVSINLEDFPYPHPVSMLEFTLHGEPVRMAFMDVHPPAGPAAPAVVLLHGGNYFGAAWANTIVALRDAGFRVVAIDQVGYGRSSKPIIPYTLDMHASNTRRVLEHLQVGRAAVVGHSMGGMIATRFAFLFPDATTHLVMVNPIGLAEPRAGRGWVEPRPQLERSYSSIVSTIRGHVQRWDDAYLEYVRVHYGWTLSGEWPRLAMVRALNGDVMRTAMMSDWPQVAAPALIIGGAEDGPRFPELVARAAEAMPRGQSILFPGVGHNPHWEAPELLHAAIIEFLRRQ